MNHKLKTVNPYFEQMWLGIKMFDIRENDRNFLPEDQVEFYEYNPQTDLFLARSITGRIHTIINDAQICKRKTVILLFKELTCFDRGKKTTIHRIC